MHILVYILEIMMIHRIYDYLIGISIAKLLSEIAILVSLPSNSGRE